MNRLQGTVLVLGLLLPAAAMFGASGLNSDEHVLLYPALGRHVSGGWELQLHGLVYEPGRHTLMAAALRKALGIHKDDLTAAERQIFRQRAEYFLVDDERGKSLTLELGAQSVALGTSEANGHFQALAVIPSAALPASTTEAKPGTLPARLVERKGGHRDIELRLVLLGDSGVSVISDIDDTIKISQVRDKQALVQNTFCRPFQPVPGMAAVYQRWATEGAQFHYVTASPWQLYVPLSEFVLSNGFPTGTFHMKSFRAKDSTFLALMKSPERYKPPVIEELFRQFPNRRFVLVGDSGEKDPEIYGELARKHPKQVIQIVIRDVTDEPSTSARYRKAFRDLAEGTWQVFQKPESLKWNATRTRARREDREQGANQLLNTLTVRYWSLSNNLQNNWFWRSAGAPSSLAPPREIPREPVPFKNAQ